MIEAIILEQGQSKIITHIPITIPSSMDPSDEAFQMPIQVTKNFRLDLKSSLMSTLSLPSQTCRCEQVVSAKLDIVNDSPYNVIIQKVCIKQRVAYRIMEKKRQPKTELVYELGFTEGIDSECNFC